VDQDSQPEIKIGKTGISGRVEYGKKKQTKMARKNQFVLKVESKTSGVEHRWESGMVSPQKGFIFQKTKKSAGPKKPADSV